MDGDQGTSSFPRRVEIPPYPRAKRIAVTLSFDDGVIEDRRLVEGFNKWGLRSTFNLNSAVLGTKGYLACSEVAELYRGHEVAIHTRTHPVLIDLDPGQVAREVLEDRIALEDLVGYPVRGMAYPFGPYNDRVIAVLRALGVVYCRTVENRTPCFPPAEPLAWAMTAHQFASDPTIPQRWKAFYGNPRSNGCFAVWGHSYEFERPTPRWDDLPLIFEPMAHKPDIWYCTNIEMFDYEAARRRVVIAANRRSAINPSGIPVTILVDGKMMELPPGQISALPPKSATTK